MSKLDLSRTKIVLIAYAADEAQVCCSYPIFVLQVLETGASLAPAFVNRLVALAFAHGRPGFEISKTNDVSFDPIRFVY
jgi:hypothetical protein